MPSAECSTMELLYLLREFRHHLEEIPDNPVVRHFEDRRVLVLVDGHDDLGRAHPREVLDRPRDADRDVQRRADRLAGLPHLVRDRKSTRLNSSHLVISYAVFCLKKKTKPN